MTTIDWNKPIETEDGLPCEPLFDSSGKVKAVIVNDSGRISPVLGHGTTGSDQFQFYDGYCLVTIRNSLPKLIKGWINIYSFVYGSDKTVDKVYSPSQIYTTRELADSNADLARVDCIEIEYRG